MTLKEKLETLYPHATFMLPDGMDEAFLGIDSESGRVVYSADKIIEILMREMNEADAREYYEYNILGAYVGDDTPLWIEKIDL